MERMTEHIYEILQENISYFSSGGWGLPLHMLYSSYQVHQQE
jgi:hypothetical protein